MRLLLIGAGPKSIAVAAKAHVLRELGWRTPEITILERKEVAANWSGKNGFTHGLQPLGTPPEKDIGFPYESELELLGVAKQQLQLQWLWCSALLMAQYGSL